MVGQRWFWVWLWEEPLEASEGQATGAEEAGVCDQVLLAASLGVEWL